MKRLLRVTLAVAVAVVAGCSSVPKPAVPAATEAAAVARSSWDITVGRTGADGRLDLPTSLAAFTMAVGPVPGAKTPAGPYGPIASGTLAVQSVLAHWSALSSAQRRAVLAGLGVTGSYAPAAYRQAPTATDPNVRCQSQDSAGAAPYRAMLGGIESDLASRFGRPLSVADRVFVSVNTKDLEHAMLYTIGCTDSPDPKGKINGCTIHINPSTIAANHSAAEVRSFLIHEMAHCFLFDRFGNAYDKMPAWYVEGAPTYAMVDLGTSSVRLSGIWQEYLDTPARPLSARTYAGVGFFVHLAETGTNPWTKIDAIGAAMRGKGAAATPAGWAAADVPAAFVGSWGSGFVQGRYPGQAWTSTAAHLPAYQPALPNGRLADGGSLTVTAPAYAAAADHLDVDAEVVLAAPGVGTEGRVTLGGGKDAALSGGPFCTRGSCNCPSGSARAGTSFTAMASGDAYLGLSGGAVAGTATLAGLSLADFCAKPTTPCLVGRWTSVGFAITGGKIVEHGGAGVTMHIDPQGKATVVYTGMSPVTFSSRISNPPTAGHFTFSGSVTGSVKLPSTAATTGPWEQVTSSGAGNIRVDVKITEPISYHLGPISVSSLAGAAAGGGGGAIAGPQVTSGTWRCAGDTLVSTPPLTSVAQGTWTLNRTGRG
ncbi:MAG: hypothetical protein QOC94_1082 [Actinoplanes sp.]|nr:hypothetical protein [Actinoplanes sp.]